MAWVLEGAGGGARFFFWCHPFIAPFSQRAHLTGPSRGFILFSCGPALAPTQTKRLLPLVPTIMDPSKWPSDLWFETSHRQIPSRVRDLFLVGLQVNYYPYNRRDDSGEKRLSLGQARRHPLYSHPTPPSPCGFPGTVYFIRYIPTAPYRVCATVRAAD